MSRALVIGSEGQDGTLLVDLLRRRGDEVVGVGRARTWTNFGLDLPPVSVTDAAPVRALIDAVRPDEIYYLAAHHHAARQTREPPAELYRLSHAVNVDGYLNVLAAVADIVPAARVFYAASSHVFGRPHAWPQDEQTPLAPANVYAVTKTAAIHLGRLFRTDHGLRVSAGILYNHESHLRKADFVSQRIVGGAVDIAEGRAATLHLGDLSATVDWGSAADTVDAMARVLSADPGEYVVATGVPHRVEDFAREAFAAVGLDWRAHVRSDAAGPSSARLSTVSLSSTAPLVGNAAKLRAATGWTPSVSFEDMVHDLVRRRMNERPNA